MAREIKRPETRLPRAAMVLRKLEKDRSRRKKVKKAIMQAMVDRIGPNLCKADQFMIKKAMKPPRTPLIAVSAPTITVFKSSTDVNKNAKYIISYMRWLRQGGRLAFVWGKFSRT